MSQKTHQEHNRYMLEHFEESGGDDIPAAAVIIGASKINDGSIQVSMVVDPRPPTFAIVKTLRDMADRLEHDPESGKVTGQWKT